MAYKLRVLTIEGNTKSAIENYRCLVLSQCKEGTVYFEIVTMGAVRLSFNVVEQAEDLLHCKCTSTVIS